MRAVVTFAALLALAPLLSGCLAPGEARGQTIREFDLEARAEDVEVYPGKTITMWTYNGEVPGPLIRVTEGDLVRIRFTNAHDLPHTIHFHGEHPFEMDGDDHQAVAPGESFTYEFVATRAGAYVYHCHVDTPVHIPAGLYGHFIVDPKEGWPGGAVDEELFVTFSDWNPNHNATAETYMINGKAFPSTEPFRLQTGDRARMFLTSMSSEPVAAHLHGTLLDEVWPAQHPIDVVPLAHAETRVVLYHATQPGAWMFHDHYEQHLTNAGRYPGGALTAIEVGREYWGTFHHLMGIHGGPARRAAEPEIEPREGDVEVVMDDYSYDAPALTVAPGTRVVWRNAGETAHTITSDSPGGPLASPLIAPGESWAFTFEGAGTFAYHCEPHSAKAKDGSWKGMTATITVA